MLDRTELQQEPAQLNQRIGRARFLLEFIIATVIMKTSISFSIIPTLVLGIVLLLVIWKNAQRLRNIGRSEWWIIVLVASVIFVFIYGLICGLNGVPRPDDNINTNMMPVVIVGMVIPWLVLSIGIFFAIWASVKRLRDIKQSVWWVTILIAMFIFSFILGLVPGLRSQLTNNAYVMPGIVYFLYMGVLLSRPSVFPKDAGTIAITGKVPNTETENRVNETSTGATVSDIEDRAFAQAASELDTNQRDAGVWARAYSNAEGDENRAKALYIRYRAQHRWNWKKLSKRTLKAVGVLIVGSVLVILGILGYARWEKRLQVATSLGGIAIGEKFSDVVFRQGQFEKRATPADVVLKYQDQEQYEKKDERKRVRVRGGIVETVSYKCKASDYTSVNGIACGDSGDKIREIFGEGVRILCRKRNDESAQLARVYDVIEYGTRYFVLSNNVSHFEIATPKELETLVGLNWDQCK